MSLETRLAALISAIGADIKAAFAGPSAIASREWFLLDDFQGENQSVWASSVSGTAAAVGSSGITDVTACGILQLTTGSTATGRSAMRSNQNASLRLGQGLSQFTARIRIPILSDGTQTYVFRAGFGDTDGGDQVDGVYFEYDAAASTFWRIKTANNSVRTITNTTVTVAIDTWYKLDIEVNAAGTEAKFYINDVLVGTHSANIPTGAGRDTGIGVWIVKSVGTTARNILVDWLGAKIRFTTLRV